MTTTYTDTFNNCIFHTNSANSLHLAIIDDQRIILNECYNYAGQRTLVQKHSYAREWSLAHKQHCPQYSDYEISKIGKLLKRN